MPGALTIINKLESKLRYVSTKDMKKIHKNRDVATDLIVLYISNYNGTFKKSKEHTSTAREKMGFKRIYSKTIKNQVRYDSTKTSPYSMITRLAVKENILEQGLGYSSFKGEERSKEYRLKPRYFGKGFTTYNMRTDIGNRLKNRKEKESWEAIKASVIGRNSMKTSLFTVFPGEEEAKEILDTAIKKGYKNRRGKILVWGKTNSSRYNENKYVLAETYLNHLSRYRDGARAPVQGKESSGGRVYDGFNMIPRLFRDSVLFRGEKLVECDYSTMHPNLAQTIYGDSKGPTISHDKVTEDLNPILESKHIEGEYIPLTRQEVKIMHLSFFNKTIEDMRRCPLHDYYSKHHNRLLMNVEDDKMRYGYKITSKKLFTLEVEIMSRAIEILDNKNITVLYCFDALYCREADQKEVVKTMNYVASIKGTKTRV